MNCHVKSSSLLCDPLSRTSQQPPDKEETVYLPHEDRNGPLNRVTPAVAYFSYLFDIMSCLHTSQKLKAVLPHDNTALLKCKRILSMGHKSDGYNTKMMRRMMFLGYFLYSEETVGTLKRVTRARAHVPATTHDKNLRLITVEL